MTRSRNRSDNSPMQASAGPGEIRELMQHQLRQLKAFPERAREIAPFMLWGAPGVGKSSIVRELCVELEIGFIDIRLAQMDPVDIRGLPVPREERVEWLLSSLWPREPGSRGILLFDELTAVDRSLQVAVYELILDRRLGTLYDVPPGWLMVAAGNRVTDGAVTTTMSSALANRFCHLEVTPDLEDWLAWAATAGIHPDVTGFLRFRPECFHDMEGDLERGWPSARTWDRVSEMLHRGELSERGMELMVCGLVGLGAGREFMGFMDWSSRIPDVERLLANPQEFEFPRRADQRHALCSALVYYLWNGTAENLERRLDAFVEIGKRMPSDFAAMAMIDALGGGSTRMDERALKLIEHPEYHAWTRIHGEAFDRHRRGAIAA